MVKKTKRTHVNKYKHLSPSETNMVGTKPKDKPVAKGLREKQKIMGRINEYTRRGLDAKTARLEVIREIANERCYNEHRRLPRVFERSVYDETARKLVDKHCPEPLTATTQKHSEPTFDERVEQAMKHLNLKKGDAIRQIQMLDKVSGNFVRRPRGRRE